MAPSGGKARRLAREARVHFRMARHAGDDAQERKDLEARVASAVRRFHVRAHPIVPIPSGSHVQG